MLVGISSQLGLFFLLFPDLNIVLHVYENI